MGDPTREPVGLRGALARPLPAAFATAGVTAATLLTLGGLSLLSTRGIMQRDAQEIVTAGTVAAAATLPHDAVVGATDIPAAERPEVERVLAALSAALPDAVRYEVAAVQGDSLTVLAERTTPGAAADAEPSRLGRPVVLSPEVTEAWASGRPAVRVTQSQFAWATGFRVMAPVRNADGAVVAAVGVTAEAAHYIRWDAELRDTALAGIAVVIALAALSGLAAYRTERSRLASEAQLVAAKEAAEATARSRGEFLANMSHEIRTPLHGVLGMTEALLATPHTEADRRSLTVINRSASSLLGILNDILDYSKLEAGRVDLVNAPFDPRALADDVTDLFAVRAEEKGIDLAARETARSEHWPVGDAARIRQVLLNLVGNAVKFTEKGSVQVELSTVAIGRKTIALRVAVRDTGIGIAPDVQERVFEQFSQAEGSTARRYGGTGLGLTISRQLVLLMGGTISVSSVPRQGSEFVVNLQLPAGPAGIDAPGRMPFPAGERVLICTPLPATLAALSELCARERLTVESCTTPEQAVRILERGERFAAVFCDGFGDDARPHDLAGFAPPLVVLTTVHRPLNNSTLSTLGAAGQLRRPVRQDHFSALVADLAAGRLKVPPEPPLEARDVRSPPAPPASRREAPAPPASPPVPGAAATGRVAGADGRGDVATGPRVLVVDDVDLNLIVARAMLASLGVTVLTAAGGDEALDILAREPMDLILMDCHMPGKDGYDVTKSIRNTDGPNRDAPIVALSASAFQEDRDRAMASGMNDFATKPIELESLRNVLARWTGGPVNPESVAVGRL